MRLVRSLLAPFLLAFTVALDAQDSAPVLLSTKGDGWSSVEDLKKAANQGKVEAEAALGEMMLTGDQVTKDIPGGISLLEKAASGGSGSALFRLGKTYDDGELVPRDAAKARDYYRRAGDKGVAEAQYNLGAMLVGGQGGRRDYAEGLAWLMIATKNGAKGEGEKQVREHLQKTGRGAVVERAQTRMSELLQEISNGASPETDTPAVPRIDAPARQKTEMTPPVPKTAVPVDTSALRPQLTPFTLPSPTPRPPTPKPVTPHP
jgi:TPR repeat protein